MKTVRNIFKIFLVLVLSLSICACTNDNIVVNEEATFEGTYELDYNKTSDANRDKYADIYVMLGSLLRQCGSEMIIDDTKVSFYAGGQSGYGNYTIDEGVLVSSYTSYNDPSWIENLTITFEDGEVRMDIPDMILYWVKK